MVGKRITSPFGIVRSRGRAEASAVVRADPLELVAPGLPAPGEVPPSCVGLLALGGLESIGRV